MTKMTDKQVLDIIRDHSLENPRFLDKLDKAALRREVTEKLREQKRLALAELGLQQSKYTVKEYRAKMKEICDGDMTLFHHEYDNIDWFGTQFKKE